MVSSFEHIQELTLWILGNFACFFLSSAVFFFFFFLFCFVFSKSTFSKNSFRNTIKVSNSLDSDPARQYVGPDLDPNCLQRLSADNTRGQRIERHIFLYQPRASSPDGQRMPLTALR